ncbi:MAG: serine/threonine-protein kinase [Trueperaceae bacterium]|nr:serine/threonine-protein kinase [Trueperaceae bacterium]
MKGSWSAVSRPVWSARIGQEVGGGFRVVQRLVSSRVSQVYLVSDGAALRVLKLFGPRYEARAEREFRIGSRLEHPHLGRAVGRVEPSGCPGVLMDYVPGVRFGGWCRRDDVTCDDVLAATRGVATALGYLHDHDILHRDVKPDNILVSAGRHARLIDFDLAVERDAQRRSRGFSGTLIYLSPEQVRGEILGPASDLYSLGIVLYWGVTGQLPFTGSPDDILAAHRYAPPPRPSDVSARLEPFDALFARLLAKDPQARPQSAVELIARLEEVEGGLEP